MCTLVGNPPPPCNLHRPDLGFSETPAGHGRPNCTCQRRRAPLWRRVGIFSVFRCEFGLGSSVVGDGGSEGGHLQGGGGGFGAFVAGFGTGSLNGLLNGVRGQHSEDDRHPGVQRH